MPFPAPHPAELQPKPRPAPYPKRSPADRRFSALDAVMARDADWEEGKHPRASNGQFGQGGTAHIVTTSDGETTTFHHVGTSKRDATSAHAGVDEDEHGEAEYHMPKVKGRPGDRSDAVHIAHAQDGAGGTDIYGVHLDYGAALATAHDASAAEWEENGPRRSEVGLSDLEAAGLATSWNEDHAGDHDDVMVKVDGDGDPVLDDSGGFKFVQDGQDVEPSEDMVAAFDELREDEFPEDDAAAYPGLDEANDHFEAEGRHEAVFRIHTHRPGARDAALRRPLAAILRRAAQVTHPNPKTLPKAAAAPARVQSSAFRDRLDLARQADAMAAAAPARPIPIRSVPRAAIAALVKRLVAEGVQHGG